MTSARDRARAEALVIEKLEDYLAIEDILELEQQSDPFGDVRCDSVDSFEQVDQQADSLRASWSLGIDPIPSMTDLLEDHGIKVVEADLPERFDGLACEVKRTAGKPDTEAVVISSRTNVERKRFNLARELAHRVIKGTAGPELKPEKAMNRFAAAFLAPAAHLRSKVGENRSAITYHELIRLKQFYGMSAAAMLIRLRDVGLLPEATVDYAFRTYARAWRTDEPSPIRNGKGLSAFERPSRFDRLVFRALAEELISPVRAAQLLKRPVAAVEEEIRGPRGQ